MSFVWSFDPEVAPNQERPSKVFVPRKEKKHLAWVAPEHARIAASMRRDYPRNNKGEPLPGAKRELVVDKRPTVMVPARRARMGFK